MCPVYHTCKTAPIEGTPEKKEDSEAEHALVTEVKLSALGAFERYQDKEH